MPQARGRPARQHCPAILRCALAALTTVLLSACVPTPGTQVGDGVLVADEEVYPGEAGPHLGAIARSETEATELWEILGLSDAPPPLDDEVLVTLSGGEPDDCPWRVGDLAVADAAVIAVRPNGWLRRLRAGGSCDGGWSPRTVAFTVPADRVHDDLEVALQLPWEVPGEPVVAHPLAERPDPDLWANRTLSTEDLRPAWGCESEYVAASTPGDAVRLLVHWSGIDRLDVTDGFSVEGDLPMDELGVSILSGSNTTSDLCNDIDMPHRPLVAGRWVATSGHLDIEVREEDRSGYIHPLATVVLRDATFEPVDPSDGDPWYVEEIRFDDAPIGGFAG